MLEAAGLDLLRRVAITANDGRSVMLASQVCLNEVCEFTGWPIGNLFFVDEHYKPQCHPMVIWSHCNRSRYRRFCKAIEMYVHYPGSKFLAEIRFNEARKAGLKRSFGFSVMADEKLVAVLEFSTDKAVLPKQVVLEIVALVGIQLGHIFERRCAASTRQCLSQHIRQQNAQHQRMVQNFLSCTNRFLPPLKTDLEQLNAIANRVDLKCMECLTDAINRMERYVSELSTIARSTIEFPRSRVIDAHIQ
jgi:hypothetical protein